MQPFLSTQEEIRVPKPGEMMLRIRITIPVVSEQSIIADAQHPVYCTFTGCY